MNGHKFISILGRKFPRRIAEEFDYVGLMAGKIPNEINKVLLCLDYDEEVFEIAKDYKPDLILTHHPFIFGKQKEVFEEFPFKKELYDKTINSGFVVYSMHTNFDAGKGGMNDALASALGLRDVYTPEEDPIMRIGYLEEEKDINDFVRFSKEQLKVNYGLLVSAGKKTVKKVGIIGGGGSRDYPVAIKEGCDIYISGDTPHHVRREILAYHFNYLDLPHEIEKIFIPTMKNIINNIDGGIDTLCVDHEKEPEVI